ncbi:hypothetical protein GC194_06305 [bacterium]|nr:hypothetical protein [bacterium]
MKYAALLILLMTAAGVHAQTYYVKLDSFKTLSLQSGKTYKIKGTSGLIEKKVFDHLEGDTLVFEDEKLYYKNVVALRNPKRKAFLDALALPVTVGSCVAVSTIPISYIKGYFLADTDIMLTSVALFIVETILFSSTRNYLSNNKKWIEIAKLQQLEWGEKA